MNERPPMTWCRTIALIGAPATSGKHEDRRFPAPVLIAGQHIREHTEGGRNGAALPKGNPMKRFALIAAATAAFAFIPSTAALAEPASTTGCPASNQVLEVAVLFTLGYRLPVEVDAEGNGNGRVCGKPLNPVVQERACPAATCAVDVIYTFRDDDLTR